MVLKLTSDEVEEEPHPRLSSTLITWSRITNHGRQIEKQVILWQTSHKEHSSHCVCEREMNESSWPRRYRKNFLPHGIHSWQYRGNQALWSERSSRLRCQVTHGVGPPRNGVWPKYIRRRMRNLCHNHPVPAWLPRLCNVTVTTIISMERKARLSLVTPITTHWTKPKRVTIK